LEVFSSAQPLRVILAWSDPPASLSASAQLVNDLDLVVIGPGNVKYYGNDDATGDRINNVEGVIINNPPLGQYVVEVRAFNAPIASQPYALAVGGPLTLQGQFGLGKTANPASTVEPGERITYTLSVSAFGGPIDGAVLSDTLPVSTTFVSASDAYTLVGNTVQWALGDLTAGQTLTRTLIVDVLAATPAGAQIVNNNYRASGASVPVVSGAPVGIGVSALKRVYLPVVLR
jgi:uncharacterized repeat protein (TIGR01451 family)